MIGIASVTVITFQVTSPSPIQSLFDQNMSYFCFCIRLHLEWASKYKKPHYFHWNHEIFLFGEKIYCINILF